ncbi:hypothetical protein GCM10020221_20370 [Streptomyces thioluteus]|uniref:Transcriptional repressor n=1 Tax=Streptomyces thioluteus TaxID=66431 RepID=A0ABP6JAK9_STRTU
MSAPRLGAWWHTDWQSDLRRRGYRLTPPAPARAGGGGPAGARDAGRHPHRGQEDRRGVNISTVYRTLELLEELGLVSHAHLGHGAPTYHLADRHDHIHLVCRDCTG